ncbi:hypothetical protein FRB91_005532 [Serendipita sp. 411]|nr:hypothetical protein FRB91_005532 [Serendipita sp. 411]
MLSPSTDTCWLIEGMSSTRCISATSLSLSPESVQLSTQAKQTIGEDVPVSYQVCKIKAWRDTSSLSGPIGPLKTDLTRGLKDELRLIGEHVGINALASPHMGTG